ncbi:glycoside hydrolase family 16 protein [Polyporus arcularius HHB13444]|uniref:Glycoside hydrolase family 16 protein n=1 Tax=Polyporus arcularius HHB13444 TaxID=1314778 RepID=A0A5C3PJD0_9APHY|nr:glycoside hydrolase family 16 protein [Polyporus arcularius HHB13444]
MALSLAATPTVTPAVAYNIARDYSGTTFFDGWDYYGFWDNLTLSQVWWLNETQATAEHLAYVNDAGRAVIRVDNTTNLPDGVKNRDTVRITTKDFYDYGSLWVFDATHLPYGCSVWPAFWTKGATWPDNGEIDIVEGINLMDHNQMAIHTLDGCTTDKSIVQTGQLGSTDCGTGSGCTVRESKANSFGEGFAQAGGGVWATQFDVAGIYMWFWNRADVPAELTQNTSAIDISSWGTPSASYPTSAQCNVTNFFTPQQLVLDIALCGDWAGVQSIYSQDCPGTCGVAGPGSPAYDNAYFEINYVRAYTTGPPLPSSTPTPSTTSTVAATVITSAPVPTANTDTGNKNGARRIGSSVGVLALVASVLGMLVLS